MPNNYIFRPEYFGGILIDRDTFEKWELDEKHSLYLWIYYHIRDVEQSLKILNDFYEDINLDEELILFTKNNIYNMPKKYTYKNKLTGFKSFLENELILLKKRKYLSAPLELSMYLTSKCQLNCDFCFMNDLIRGNNNSIPISKALKIIDMFVDNGIESISLLGGEPLLYEEILNICEFIESKKVHFTITTNGILLNEKILRRLSKFSYLRLAFSVINIKESNNMYSNKMLKNIKKNIVLASKMGIRTAINTVLINQKIEDLVEIVDFCNENNIERYSMATFANVETRAKVTLSINDCLNFYLKLSDYVNKNKYNIDLALEGCMIYSAAYGGEDIYISDFQRLSYGCQAAQTNIDIMFDGNAYACSLLRDKSVIESDVFNKNFDEIWDSIKFSPIRDYKVLDKKCKSCTYNIFCNGGCFVEKQIVNNKYDKCCDSKCYRYLGV